MSYPHNMSHQDRLYDKELHKLRAKIREFASEQSEAARQLEVNDGMPSDPDISRLLEGVAWLCTQLQLRLDDGYESVCRQILQLFYPDFLKPIPSLGILKFDTGTLKEATTLAKGSFFELIHKKGKYRFQTCQSAYLPPIYINNIELLSAPFPESFIQQLPEVHSALKVSLTSNDLTTDIREYLGQGVEFYANSNVLMADEFLDALFSSLKCILLACDQQVISIPLERLSWPGFSRTCSILPTDPGLSDSHRLLMDFFQAPELFRFLHLDLTGYIEEIGGPTLDILWLLEDEVYQSKGDIGRDHLLLGCTPVINLYEVHSDPVNINHETHDIPLSMGPLNQNARVRELLSVTDITNPQQVVELSAVFHSSFEQDHSEMSWQLSRDHNTDYLQLINTRWNNHPGKKLLAVKCLCYDPQANNLPVTSKVRPITVSLPCEVALLKNTSTVSVDGLFSTATSWDLLSTLQLNTRSFKTGQNEARKLRQLLQLFIHQQSGTSNNLLHAIESLEVSHELQPAVADNRYYVSHGSCFHLNLNCLKLTSIPAILLLNLLHRVLNYWRPMGTHSRMVARLTSGTAGGEKKLSFPVLNDD